MDVTSRKKEGGEGGSGVDLGTAASVSPGNLLAMQIPGPHPRSTESGTPAWGSAICILVSFPGSSDAH